MNDTACRLQFLQSGVFCSNAMTMCETVVSILSAQLKALYARECRAHQELRRHITEALAHFGTQMQALQLQDPLEMHFLEVYSRLAIWRIEQFRRDIEQRIAVLNDSPLVQKAMQALQFSAGIAWMAEVPAAGDLPASRDARLQHINAGFFALLHGLEQVQQQMVALIQGLRNLEKASG